MSRAVPRVIHDLLAAAAAEVPDRVAFVDEREQLSYGSLYEQALGLATALRERGFSRGDRVLLMLENGAACPIGLFATLLAGGAYSFVNPQTKEDKFAFLLADAEPHTVIIEAPLAERFAGVLRSSPSVRVVVTRERASAGGFELMSELAGTRASLPGDLAIPLDLSALIYTSGSTGRPKGTMMTHQSMLYSIGALVEVLRLEPGMRTLTVLPFSFNYGMYQMLLNVACRGTLFIEASFAFPSKVLEKLAQLEIQAFPGVPTIFARLAALHVKTGAKVPSLLRLTNTAAALSEDLVQKIESMCPNALVFRMYGLTECKRALYLEPELGSERPGSVGVGLPGVDAYLGDLDGRPAAAGEPGILCIRSPGVMLGYWKLPEESARVLKPGRLPGENIFVTGDLFRTDADGYFYFLGRSDDIIKTRGEKVSPAEVEGVLYAFPGVQEAAVVGVPDEVLGEAVRAYLALEPGQEAAVARVRKHCMERLEPFMVPRDVVFLGELPKTSTGKIDKKTLREKAKAEPAPT